jgi:hypothetical protein
MPGFVVYKALVVETTLIVEVVDNCIFAKAPDGVVYNPS